MSDTDIHSSQPASEQLTVPDSLESNGASLHRGAVLTTGFGTTVAIAALGYVTHMPGVLDLERFELYIGLGIILLVLGSGYRFGAQTRLGVCGGALAGFVTAALLLIVVSAWFSDETKNTDVPSPWIWLPGFLASISCVMALGSFLGSAYHAGSPLKTINWGYRFSWVTLYATVLVLVAGAVVTGEEAGLSVHGWPDSFKYNMFLYPVSFLTGNRFYEHTHRLFGSLLGLTTLALAIQLFRVDPRGWLKKLALIAFVMVCVQGYMGGQRVNKADFPETGVEVALAEHETDASAVLRVAHGAFAQVFFAVVVVIATATATTWKNARPTPHITATTDHYLGLAVVGLLMVQLLLGAMVRHLHANSMGHIGVAMIVFMASLGLGMRAWGVHGPTHPTLKKLGVAILCVVSLQLLLGFGALIATGGFSRVEETTDPTTADVVITTLHQANGAVLLAVSVALTLFAFRLLVPKPASD